MATSATLYVIQGFIVSDCDHRSSCFYSNVIFCCFTQSSEIVQVLTVLPKSCSIRTVDREFRASNSIARHPKRLVEDKGILSLPTHQFGTILLDITVDNVK